jgi:hypothetical protein
LLPPLVTITVIVAVTIAVMVTIIVVVPVSGMRFGRPRIVIIPGVRSGQR